MSQSIAEKFYSEEMRELRDCYIKRIVNEPGAFVLGSRGSA
jgi:hypothetical protein